MNKPITINGEPVTLESVTSLMLLADRAIEQGCARWTMLEARPDPARAERVRLVRDDRSYEIWRHPDRGQICVECDMPIDVATASILLDLVAAWMADGLPSIDECFKTMLSVHDRQSWSSHRLAAENIRRLLRRRFEGVDFTVRSRSFAGGTAVDVEWDGMPTADEVAPLVRRFEYGHFDGMTDGYDYKPGSDPDRRVRTIFGTAKYVQLHRRPLPAAR